MLQGNSAWGAEGLVVIMQFIYLFLKYLLIYLLGCGF